VLAPYLGGWLITHGLRHQSH